MHSKHNKYTLFSVSLPNLVITKWLTGEEKKSVIYTDPALALEEYRAGRFQMKDKEALEFTVNEIQRLFNIILRKYFNTPNHLILYSIKEEVARLRHTEEATGISLTRDIVFEGDPHVAISSLYTAIQALAKKVGRGEVQRVSIGAPLSKQPFLRESPSCYGTILALQKELLKLSATGLCAATLQGSFGSGDALQGWSDLDVVLVLDDRVFKEGASLHTFKQNIRRLAYACYKIDPLAHHEFIYLTQLDVKRNIPALYPTPLLSYGKRLMGEEMIDTTSVNSTYQHLHSLFRVMHYFRNKDVNKKFSETKYMWKNDLAHLFIIPSLALQALDILVYKKDSFDRIKNEFPGIDTSILEEASLIRMQWKLTNLLLFYPNFLLFNAPLLVTRIATSLVRKPLLKTSVNYPDKKIESYTRRMKDFSENLFTSVYSRLIS